MPPPPNRLPAILILIGSLLRSLTNKSGLLSPKLYAALLIIGGLMELSGIYLAGDIPFAGFLEQILPQIEGLLLLLAGGALVVADRRGFASALGRGSAE